MVSFYNSVRISSIARARVLSSCDGLKMKKNSGEFSREMSRKERQTYHRRFRRVAKNLVRENVARE
jgi:hypothetical protein